MSKYQAVLETMNYQEIKRVDIPSDFDDMNPYMVASGHLCEVFWKGGLKCINYDAGNNGLTMIYQNEETGERFIARLFRDGRPFSDQKALDEFKAKCASQSRMTVFGFGKEQGFDSPEDAGAFVAKAIIKSCGPNYGIMIRKATATEA